MGRGREKDDQGPQEPSPKRRRVTIDSEKPKSSPTPQQRLPVETLSAYIKRRVLQSLVDQSRQIHSFEERHASFSFARRNHTVVFSGYYGIFSKSVASVHDSDYRETIEQYNIYLPGKAPPPEFKQEVEEWVFRIRDSPDLEDDFTDHLKEIAKSLQNKAEEEVRNKLGAQIISCYSTPSDERMEVNHGRLWNRTVPIHLDQTVIEPPLPLPKPKPDTTFGYAKAAFSRPHLATMNLLVQAPNGLSFASPGQDVRFPFAVIEYKSQAKDGSIRVVTNQAAGAGAIALNGFLKLMSRDPGLDKIDLKKALFFSVAMDQNSAYINMEWVDKIPETDQYSFHVEELRMLPLRYGDSIQVLRRVLKNVYDYALDERLKLILDALDNYRDDVTRQKNVDSEETIPCVPQQTKP